MSEDRSLKEIQKAWPQTLKSYFIGFFSCLVLTALAFVLVAIRAFQREVLIVTLIGLGFVQAFMQLVFFMHLARHTKPRWMLIVFCFMVLVLIIVVTLSMWIMFDLDGRVMPAMR